MIDISVSANTSVYLNEYKTDNLQCAFIYWFTSYIQYFSTAGFCVFFKCIFCTLYFDVLIMIWLEACAILDSY